MGSHKPCIGRSNLTQYTYLYHTVNTYNKLPDLLTRMSRKELFKIWLKRHYAGKTEIPENAHNPQNMIPDTLPKKSITCREYTYDEQHEA